MEGVEVLVEHLAGRAERVRLVEVEDVADAVEDERRDLALAGRGAAGRRRWWPWLRLLRSRRGGARGRAAAPRGASTACARPTRRAGRASTRGPTATSTATLSTPSQVAQAGGDGVGHRGHERAPARGEHEVHAHVAAVDVDVLHDAHVHDADAAVGAAGVVDARAARPSRRLGRVPRVGSSRPPRLGAGRRRSRCAGRWWRWRGRGRRAARGWRAGPSRGPGGSRRARRASRRRRAGRPPTPRRCRPAARPRTARRRPGARPPGRSAHAPPSAQAQRLGVEGVAPRPRAPVAAAGGRLPLVARRQAHPPAGTLGRPRAEGRRLGERQAGGGVVGQHLGARAGGRVGRQRVAGGHGEARAAGALVTGWRPIRNAPSTTSRSSPGSPSR